MNMSRGSELFCFEVGQELGAGGKCSPLAWLSAWSLCRQQSSGILARAGIPLEPHLIGNRKFSTLFSTPAKASLSYLSENGFALRRSVWRSFLGLSVRFSANICETRLTFDYIQGWLFLQPSEYCGKEGEARTSQS